MPQILFIDTAHPVLQQRLQIMGFSCDFFPSYSYDDYLAIIHNYTGIVVRSKIPLDASLLKQATSLRFIARVGAGMENIDEKTADDLGIVCLNAPEGNRNAVAEHAMGMLLSLLNHLTRVDAEVRQGIWKRAENRGHEIKHKTISILGYGNTGSAFAQKLSGFETFTLAYDKYKSGFSNAFVNEATMEQIFAETDILSLHLPLTEETKWLVDAAFIKRFAKPFYLINTARGQIVRTSDVIYALNEGRILGACFDVLEYEKFSFEDIQSQTLPQAFQTLLSMPNVLLSPHIAGWTHESHLKMAEVLADKIENLINKK
ncbi:MAG: D-3-phosphoglycerate dehydrogenase [Bacteroidetes bacterium]|nr:MAG: D-3-phosphoglycerate dehydrogenase [Bacteroidota bacterium]